MNTQKVLKRAPLAARALRDAPARRWTCSTCLSQWQNGPRITPRLQPVNSSPSSSPSHTRAFTTTPALLKKGNKAARDESKAASKTSTPSSSSSSGAADDPFDYSDLESEIERAITRLKEDLSKLRAGGRFNPEVLENLRLQPEKGSKEKVKIGDLAQVVPQGRTVRVMVGEVDQVKPISSAIQGSNLSLTPQPDPTGQNPLLLVINIPPPTADSRRAAVAEATKAEGKAATAVRDARGKMQKKLNGMKNNKAVRPDDLKKAGTGMEKVVEKGQGEVKRVADGSRKMLESG